LRYRSHYIDHGPHPHDEVTGNGILYMLYFSVVRGAVVRLSDITAPAGEPIPLDDAILRRFANTFLQQIARPREIDADGNLRCDVDAKRSCDRTADAPWYFNVTTDGWVNLSVVDPTVFRIVRDVAQRQTARLDALGQPSFGQPDLTIA